MSDMSKKIFDAFQKSIKKQCPNRTGRFWYSDEIKDINGQIRLITINVNQPKEYDLKIEKINDDSGSAEGINSNGFL